MFRSFGISSGRFYMYFFMSVSMGVVMSFMGHVFPSFYFFFSYSYFARLIMSAGAFYNCVGLYGFIMFVVGSSYYRLFISDSFYMAGNGFIVFYMGGFYMFRRVVGVVFYYSFYSFTFGFYR